MKLRAPSKKVKNNIVISVISSIILASLYFLLSVGINTYEIQKSYNDDRVESQEKYEANQNKIVQLREEYLENVKATDVKFDSIYVQFTKNSEEYGKIAKELNELTYVIGINDEKMREDLYIIKNMNSNDNEITHIIPYNEIEHVNNRNGASY